MYRTPYTYIRNASSVDFVLGLISTDRRVVRVVLILISGLMYLVCRLVLIYRVLTFR